jgi:hypothetical protein
MMVSNKLCRSCIFLSLVAGRHKPVCRHPRYINPGKAEKWRTRNIFVAISLNHLTNDGRKTADSTLVTA